MPEPFVWQLVNTLTQKVINVYKPKLTVGRCKDVDIVCVSTVTSRSHAEFVLSEDGILNVIDLNSLNGTFLNGEVIQPNTQHKLKEGDEVGIGTNFEIARTLNNQYSIFRIKRMSLSEPIVVDDSDDEQLATTTEPTEHQNADAPLTSGNMQGDVLLLSSGESNENSEKQNSEEAGCKAEVSEISSERVPIKSEDVKCEVVQNATDNVPDNSPVTVEIKAEPSSSTSKITFEDELIVIDDDDDDINVLSQLLEVKQPPPEKRQSITEDIYYNIKKEIEEMDRMECEEWQYPLPIDSDDEPFTDIFAEELKEYKRSAADAEVAPSVASDAPIPSGAFYKKSPTAEPRGPEPSKKRKSDSKMKDESSKKQRTMNVRTDMQGIQQELLKRKKSAKRKRGRQEEQAVSKQEKQKIVEIRKEKLKELATKPAEVKTDENKFKTNKPRVKVSEGRGTFLLNNVEAVASTSKETSSAPNLEVNGLKKPHSPVQAEPDAKIQDVNMFNEIAELLSWNTNWLTKNEMLANLNPLVRLQNLRPLENNYSSYSEYFEVHKALLMVELWAHIQKEFEMNRSNNVFPMFIEDCEQTDAKVWTVKCLTYLTKKQVDDSVFVKDSDLIVVDLRLQENAQVLLKPSFGYITETTRCPLRDHHYINKPLANKFTADPPHTKVIFKMLISKCPKDLKLKCVVNFKILTSLVHHMRLFKSLKYLEHSPLISFVLKPNADDLKIPSFPLVGLVSKDALNNLQHITVMEATHVCMRPKPGIYLIQGPPGTGKTTVIKNVVLQLLYGRKKLKDLCILLVAPSNAAVDQLVLKLIQEVKPKLTEEQRREMKLIRVGPKSSVHPNVRPYLLEDVAKKNLKKELLRLSGEADERYRQLSADILKLDAEIHSRRARNEDVTRLKHRVDALRNRSENFAREILKGERYNVTLNRQCNQLLCGATVVCTTLSSCMGKKIEENVMGGKLRFTCCIVDEATQSTEQETLIPVRLGVKKMVLVGDPQQLPATVMSMDAKQLGYGCSFFQRILKNVAPSKAQPLRMLNKQYRMHPEICKFPNLEYYSGKLESAPFKYVKPLRNISPFAVFTLKVARSGSKSRQEDYQNGDEANFVHKLIEVLIEVIPTNVEVSIGIITPYRNQKISIGDLLKNTSSRKNISIDCNTVDGFQGRETDIIILSCVREVANTFINDPHRLNVALTRAKYALYVVGTQSLFECCKALVKLGQSAEQRGLLKDGTNLQKEDLRKVVCDVRKA